jgi:hypothetical protein
MCAHRHSRDLEGSAALIGVKLEIHGPHHIRRRGSRGVGSSGASTFSAPFHRNTETLILPEALDLVMVYHPALSPGVMVGPAVSPPKVVFA